MTFQLFAPGDDCTGSPVFTATVPLGPDGTAASGAFTPIAAGNYAWRATYSGDADNEAVTGACGPSSSAAAPPPPSTNPSSTPVSKSPEADLRIKVDAPKRGRVDKRLTYKVTVSNEGEGSADSVEVTARLTGIRAELEKTKGADCKGKHQATCELGALAPGKKVRLEITVLPKATGRLTLTGTVAGIGTVVAGDNRAADSIRIKGLDPGSRRRPLPKGLSRRSPRPS